MNIRVLPLRWWEKILDVIMIPFMYLVSGTLKEVPQRTHRWNNTKLQATDVEYFNKEGMVSLSGTKAASRWFWMIPIFHLPIFGGWREYVVIQPIQDYTTRWYIGWIAGDVVGISRIPIIGPVRMLKGQGNVQFFGSTQDGNQLHLKLIGSGTIGDGGRYAGVPLL